MANLPTNNIGAGQLDRLVVVEQRQVARDGVYGSEVVTWAAFDTVYANITESATANDESQRDSLAAYARPTRIRIRWLAGVDPTMRVNDGGRLYQITGTAEVGRRRFLDLACQEWAHE